MGILRALKEQRRNRVIRKAFGTTDPESVRLPDSERQIAVDPRDGRVRKILLYDPLRGRVKTNLSFWRTAVQTLRPTLCVDVGLNYGECLLGTDYPEGCRCVGFEANPRLLPYLERSHGGHPDRDRIDIRHAAVGDTAGGTVCLMIDEAWSGRSHLAASGDRGGVEVPATTVDAELPPNADFRRLLFKIDVEGFEPAVLRGMEGALSEAGMAAGFVEFDPDVLQARGADVADYWSWLRSRFDLFVCGASGGARPVVAERWAAAAREIALPHCDLIALSRPRSNEQKQLLAVWTDESRAAA